MVGSESGFSETSIITKRSSNKMEKCLDIKAQSPKEVLSK